MKRNTAVWLGLFAAGVIGTAGCEDGFGGILVSDEQEVELGAMVDVDIRQQFQIADPNDPITRWAVELVAPLAAASVEFRDPADINGYKVAVIVHPDLINAFAAPGGYVYITTPLVAQAASCGEITGVLGHELAHVTERHSIKQLEAQYGVGTLAQFLLGEGLAADIAQGLFALVLAPSYSQDAEAESDSVGLQIAFMAGYNPFGLVDFFEKLLALAGGADPSDVEQFFSSHPATSDRIASTRAEIAQRYGATVVEGQTQTYDCIGTAQQLAAIQAHIASGTIAVIPGTGEGAPPAR